MRRDGSERRALQRLPDWPARLAAYIEARRAMPFAWGTNDCLALTNGAIHAMTGVDLLRDHGAPAYDSLEAGNAELARRGLGFIDLARMTLPMIKVSMARRGDVVCGKIVSNVVDQYSYGVVVGTTFIYPVETGLIFLPVSSMTLAFAVGPR